MSSVEPENLSAGPGLDWRDRIISDPDLILEDRDVMRVLIAANDRLMGGNIVDMRGIAMERLESRLDRLEDTHRSVIAAAYDNLAGTNLIHRAILTLLDQPDFPAFLRALGTDVAVTLRVDRVRLVLESAQAGDASPPQHQKLDDVLSIVPPGFIDAYVSGGRVLPPRAITLRQVGAAGPQIFGADAVWLRSEALMALDLGAPRLPALLILGAEDAQQFRAGQGTDLLTFFASVFERLMRRWLA